MEHAINISENTMERGDMNKVKIENMRFEFMAGNDATNPDFIILQLRVKCLFILDLENAFDRVRIYIGK